MTTKQHPTPDFSTMTRAERAAYYEANADRVGETFDGERATFEADPQGVGMVVSVRLKAHEADVIAAAAREAGKPVSTYMREAALTVASGGGPAARKLEPGDLSEDTLRTFRASVLRDLVATVERDWHLPHTVGRSMGLLPFLVVKEDFQIAADRGAGEKSWVNPPREDAATAPSKHRDDEPDTW